MVPYDLAEVSTVRMGRPLATVQLRYSGLPESLQNMEQLLETVTGVEYSLALEFVCGSGRQSWRGAGQVL